jgi:4-amino-4-deoxy-L-arabinose transferase-like glycosyltransferase
LRIAGSGGIILSRRATAESRYPIIYSRQRHARVSCALAWTLLGLIWFLSIGAPPLFNPDGGRYAEIPREMLVSGDWVTPRLDGIRYFEKPPLQYWASAVVEKFVGPTTWAARLWPALCGFLGLLLTGWLTRRLYGERASRFAVIVQASALLYVALARISTLDMSLCFMLQMTLTALALLVHRPASSEVAAPMPSARRLAALLAVGVALSVLAKGLVGILIPGAVGAIYMLAYRDLRLLARARVHYVLAALALIAAPWFVLVSVRNPQFARFFFIFEHFQRYLSVKGHDRYQPAWFFVLVLAGGLIPWLSLAPRAAFEAARSARREPATGLLLIWAAFVFVFFSASQSKLVPYILPMMPAVCVLMGRMLASLSPRRLVAHLTGVAVFGLILALAVLSVVALSHVGLARPRAWMSLASPASIALFVAAFLALTVAGGIGALCSHRGHSLRGAAVTALGALLLVQGAAFGMSQLPRSQEDIQVVRALRPVIGRYRQFYCVGTYLQTVPFYLRRTCSLVGYQGELAFGLSLQPALAINGLTEFVPVWQRDSSALALVRAADYPRLLALGAQMRVLYTSRSLVAVVRQ